METRLIPVRHGGSVHVGVAFPRPMPLAVANLGYQTVFALLSAIPSLVVERAAPGDGKHPAILNGRYLATVESKTALRDLDALAVSVPYENDEPEVARLLADGGIEPLARRRGEDAPVVIAGGVAPTMNPEPTAPFADIIGIGEAEALLPSLVPLLEARAAGRSSRAGLLAEAAGLSGWYVPSVHWPDGAGRPPVRIVRQIARPLSGRVAASAFLDPEAPFGDRFLVEVSRGCPRQCRFCTVRSVYHPVRRQGIEQLLAALPAPATCSRIGLVGASLSDVPELPALLEELLARGYSYSTSSLRIESLSAEMLALLARGGNRTVTIAPESGSERIRGIIGKPTPEAEILRVVDDAVTSGYRTVKVYLMIGLPGEGDAEIAESIELVKRIRERAVTAGVARGEGINVSVSASSFVPKPWTPLQWEAMAPRKLLEERLRLLARAMDPLGGVSFSSDLPKWSEIEGYLSRGDRRMEPLVADVASGIAWPAALKRHAGVLPPIHRPWELDAPLAWEVVDTGIATASLAREAAEVRRAVGGAA